MSTGPRRSLHALRALPRGAGTVIVVAVLTLGGAVAATYGTGVLLGSRLAGPPEPVPTPGVDPATRAVPPSSGAGRGTSTPSSSLPDRVEDRTPPDERAVPPDGSRGGTGRTTDAEADDAAATAGPYRAVWPYATWPEVLDHLDRGDTAFATPDDTALRFAREVVGALRPRLGEVQATAGDALVEVQTPRGTTTVSLVRPDLGDGRVAPWGVASASGDLVVTPGLVDIDRVGAEVGGAPTVVGLHDRVGWRGVAVAAPTGAAEVRMEPGRPGPAALVALDGDPRDPSAFAVARVDIGAGAAVPLPPTDSSRAADELSADLSAGDLTGAWSRLGDQTRAAVTDWRGLAARWDGLATRLAPFAAGGLEVTTVPTATGAVDVVAPGVDAPAGARALAFVPEAGRRALASLEEAAAAWSTEAGNPPTLVVTGPTRASAVMVDGALLPIEPGGETSARAPLADLTAGAHVALALFLDGQVEVAATTVTTSATGSLPLEPPPMTTAPSTTVPAPPPTTTGPRRSTTTVPATTPPSATTVAG